MADKKPQQKQPQFDAGHVPITEEFDSAKRQLPPAAPVAIALAVVAIVVGIIAFMLRAKPVAQGGIDTVYFSEPAGLTNGMVLLQVTLRNIGSKTLYIKNIKVNLKTDQELSDDPASPSDYDRYFMAYPDLKEHATQPLVVETKIAPSAEQKGTVLVSFPVTKEQFVARKDLNVTIEPYDQNPIVLREKVAQAK
jgi:preprotein translocase subunit Sec61beta